MTDNIVRAISINILKNSILLKLKLVIIDFTLYIIKKIINIQIIAIIFFLVKIEIFCILTKNNNDKIPSRENDMLIEKITVHIFLYNIVDINKVNISKSIEDIVMMFVYG